MLPKIRLKHIEREFRDPIQNIVDSNHDIFALKFDPITNTNVTEHIIILRNEKPINIIFHRPPEYYKEKVHRQVSEMLKKKVMDPSNLAFNVPLWVVPKESDVTSKKKWRIIIDCRKLNEQRDQDAYLL